MFAAPPVAARPPRRAVHLVVAAAILLGLAAGLVGPAPRRVLAATAVTTSDLNLRSGPSTNNRVLLVMPFGAEVGLDGGQEGNWYRVTYAGTSGWASGDYLDFDGGGSGNNGGGASGNATVATDALNLRASASTSSGVLAVMYYGAAVTLTGQRSNGFVSVTFRGTNGWAYESYLSSGGGGPAPSPDPDPQPGSSGSATVAVNALNLRSSSSTSSGVLAVMAYGAGVALTGQRSNGFVSVTYNGNSGWAYESYLAIGGSPAPDPDPDPAPQPGPSGSATVATDALNLRASASTSSGVLAVMPFGAGVTLTGQRSNGFVSVTYNGRNGWAYEPYLSIGGSPAPNPNPGSGGGPRGDANGDGALSQQEIINIIYAAADRYGQPRADMLRVARCESVLDPNAVNPAGSYGLFQFIPSTWATTPYANEDIFDAYASANAAGWMWSVGRRNEWVCQ